MIRISLVLLLLVCGTSSFGQESAVQISFSSYSVKKERADMNRKSCALCHTNQGYRQVVLGGGESDAPYEEPTGIVCVTCHDPHLGEAGTGMLRAEEVKKSLWLS